MPTISGTVYDDTGSVASGRIVRAYRRDTGALLGETVSSAGLSAGDPDYLNVSSLLHLDGSNGSTTFADATGKTWSAVGNAAISTTQSQFGGASLYLDGTGDAVVADATSADFAFGTGDFTIEAFLLPNWGSGSDYMVFAPDDLVTRGFVVRVYNGTYFYAKWYDNGTVVNTGNAPFTSFAHIAIVRNSGTMEIFLNGVPSGNPVSYATDLASNGVAKIGSLMYFSDYSGYIDEFRITKGVARYTSAFTPPTAEFLYAPSTLDVGQYEIATAYTGEANVVCLDDAAGTTYNDLILRTTPI